MKVNLTAEMKKFITVAEMPAVKKVMQYEKENDEWTVQEWAKMAARLVFDDNGAKVIEATARIAKNHRVGDVSTRRRETLTCGSSLPHLASIVAVLLSRAYI